MGAGIVIKTIDGDGETKYVRLTGVEKARIYEMLAKFGVYETEQEQLHIDNIPVVGPSQVGRLGSPHEKVLKTDVKKRLDMIGRTDASTMHCCEAAEILFEDIS